MNRARIIAAALPQADLVEAARRAIVAACVLALALAGPVLPQLS